jgi:hypothetical protein
MALVPEYDAFGREIGENTLAGLGGGDEYAPARKPPRDGWSDEQLAEAAAVEPDAEATAAEPLSDGWSGAAAPSGDAAAEAPAAQPAFEAPEHEPTAPAFGQPAATVRVRKRTGAGCLAGLIVLVVIAAVPIFAVVGIVGSASDAIDEVTDAFESLPDGPPVIPEVSPPPAGVQGASLVARANLAPALERLAPMGRAATMRLAPERIDALLVKGSQQRLVQLTNDGALTRGPAAERSGGLPPIALAAIDPAAPARLVRRSAARFDVRPADINYLVLSAAPGGHRWVAYFKNGVYVEGDRRGRVIRRIS